MTLTVSRWNENWEEWEDTRKATPAEVLAEARRLADYEAAAEVVWKYTHDWFTDEQIRAAVDAALVVEAEE